VGCLRKMLVAEIFKMIGYLDTGFNSCKCVARPLMKPRYPVVLIIVLRTAVRDAREVRATYNAGTRRPYDRVKKQKDASTLEFRLPLIFDSASFIAGWREVEGQQTGSSRQVHMHLRLCVHMLFASTRCPNKSTNNLAAKDRSYQFRCKEVERIVKSGL